MPLITRIVTDDKGKLVGVIEKINSLGIDPTKEGDKVILLDPRPQCKLWECSEKDEVDFIYLQLRTSVMIDARKN